MNIISRETSLNVAAAFIGVVLFLVAAEAFFQAGNILDEDYPRHRFCSGPSDRGTFHSLYGWTERPNSKYLEKESGADDWSMHVYNQEGFRDTFDSGNESIIVLGDSFTRGTLVDQNETFPSLLDVWTPDTAFHNYGTGGYSTANEMLVYRNVSAQTPHRAVLLGYYLGNDAKGNLDRGSRHPQFSLENGSLQLDRLPRNESLNASAREGVGLIKNPVLTRIQQGLHEHSALYRFLHPRVVSTITSLRGGAQPPTGQALSQELNLTRALLAELGRAAAANDAALIITVLPESGEVNPSKPNYYRARDGKPYWDAQRRMLRNVVAELNNTVLLDMTPTFTEAVESGRRVYGKVNRHMDDRGHRLTARAMYNKLVGQNLIPNRTTPDLRTEHGDSLTGCP